MDSSSAALSNDNNLCCDDNDNESCHIMDEWICDFCKTAKFATYEEAVAHEEACNFNEENKKEDMVVPILTTTKDKAIHLDDEQQDEPQTTTIPQEIIFSNPRNVENDGKIAVWCCDVCKVASFPSLQEAMDHEAACGKNSDDESYVEVLEQPWWYCDVCKVAKFVSLEEAVEHEKNCDGIMIHEVTHINVNDDMKDGCSSDKYHDSTQPNVLEINDDSSTQNVIEINDSADSADEVKAIVNNELDLHRRSSRRSTGKSKEVTPVSEKDSSKMTKRKSKSIGSSDNQNSGGKKQKKIFNENKVTKENSLSSSGTTKSTKASSKAPLASIFASTEIKADKKTLEEQHIVEFQAKRRLMQQKERERQEKRAKLFSARTAQQTSSVGAELTKHPFISHTPNNLLDKGHKSNKKSTINTKQFAPAPRFPSPTHLIPSETEDFSVPLDDISTNEPWLTRSQVERIYSCRLGIKTSQEAPDIIIVDSCDSDSDDSPDRYRFQSDKELLTHNNDSTSIIVDEKSQLLTHAVKSFLVRSISDTNTNNPKGKDARPWVDRYLMHKDIKNDVVGESLQRAANELELFIEQWMVERQKSNAKMAARQRKLAEKFKSRTKQTSRLEKKRQSQKRSRHDDDDFLWDDESDSDLDDDNNIKSLLLLRGPVGCGKSAIVHAVAQGKDCKVLEVNTTQQRGLVDLKKILLEATQSHSSLDMLKKQRTRETAANSKRLLQSSADDLSDTDSESETATPDTGALTLVLIDEVDLMYDEDGDNGFWTALSELSKGAKCPIILTANSYPKQMSSSSFRFIDVVVDHPKPIECIPLLKHVLTSEGFRFRDDIHEESLRERLEAIIQLTGCDIRHLVYQLEAITKELDDCPLDLFNNYQTVILDENQVEVAKSPLIHSVQPATVPASKHSLITLSGSNFMSIVSEDDKCDPGYNVNVFIGDQICPLACILDDTTIIAVCPPCALPHNVDKTGLYKGTRQRSIASSLVPITVGAKTMLGIDSRSCSSVTTNELADGSTLIATVQRVNIAYYFPGYITTVSKTSECVESDEELEFGETPPLVSCTSLHSIPVTPPSQVVLQEEDSETASALFASGVEKWIAENRSVPQPQLDCRYQKQSLSEIDSVVDYCTDVSDAMFLQDVGLNGLPSLAGSVLGFGFDMTEEYPKRTNSNSKPPSEERLFNSGWNEQSYFYGNNEAYVTMPFSSKERMLLKRSARCYRGFSFVQGTFDQRNQEEEDETVKSFPLYSDEDAFLPNDAPVALTNFPLMLLRYRKPIDFPVVNPIHDEITTLEHKRFAFEIMELISDYVLPMDATERRTLFTRHEPEYDLLLNIKSNPIWFLDYLPMIRGIAITECVAECVFEATKKKDSIEDFVSTNRRVSTRRSTKLGRKHYFESIAPDYVWYDSKFTPKELGAKVANTSLIFRRKK